MTDDRSEISVFDIANWLWSFRWLMLACAVIAVGWVALTLQNSNAPTPSYEVKLQIFSGGTPMRGPGEIADILVAGINDLKLELLSAPAANPVIFRTNDIQLAKRVETDVAPLIDALVLEVRMQKTELERLMPSNEHAVLQYLRTKSFIEGFNSGLVPPIITTVTPITASSSRMAPLFIPVVASGFLFLLLQVQLAFPVNGRNDANWFSQL